MIHIETGLLLIILGYLIKKKKMIWMIAGYNPPQQRKKRSTTVKPWQVVWENSYTPLGGLFYSISSS